MNKIAIIIPGYNCENYIQKCLDSILSQEYTDYSIFFIDDGSIDSTRNIVTSIKDERLIYDYQTNSGVSAARNRGLCLAKEFEYIMFVDADDWLEKGALEIIINCIKESNNADYILFDWNKYRIRDGKKECIYCKMNERFTEDVTLECLNRHMVRSRSGGSPWGKLFKNKIITANKLEFIVDLPYAEDYLFNLSFLQRAKTVFYCPKPLYGYNCYQTGARAKFRKNLMDIYIRIEEEKMKLFSPSNMEYSDLLTAELIEQLSVALQNLWNSSFSSTERKVEKIKAKEFLKAHNISFTETIRAKTNIKVKIYTMLFLLGIMG